MSIFLNDLEQRHGEYVKIDFSIILNNRDGYNITTFWFDRMASKKMFRVSEGTTK